MSTRKKSGKNLKRKTKSDDEGSDAEKKSKRKVKIDEPKKAKRKKQEEEEDQEESQEKKEEEPAQQGEENDDSLNAIYENASSALEAEEEKPATEQKPAVETQAKKSEQRPAVEIPAKKSEQKPVVEQKPVEALPPVPEEDKEDLESIENKVDDDNEHLNGEHKEDEQDPMQSGENNPPDYEHHLEDQDEGELAHRLVIYPQLKKLQWYFERVMSNIHSKTYKYGAGQWANRKTVRFVNRRFTDQFHALIVTPVLKFGKGKLYPMGVAIEPVRKFKASPKEDEKALNLPERVLERQSRSYVLHGDDRNDVQFVKWIAQLQQEAAEWMLREKIQEEWFKEIITEYEKSDSKRVKDIEDAYHATRDKVAYSKAKDEWVVSRFIKTRMSNPLPKCRSDISASEGDLKPNDLDDQTYTGNRVLFGFCDNYQKIYLDKKKDPNDSYERRLKRLVHSNPARAAVITNNQEDLDFAVKYGRFANPLPIYDAAGNLLWQRKKNPETGKFEFQIKDVSGYCGSVQIALGFSLEGQGKCGIKFEILNETAFCPETSDRFEAPRVFTLELPEQYRIAPPADADVDPPLDPMGLLAGPAVAGLIKAPDP